VTWQEASQIFGQPLNGTKINIGKGTAVNVAQLNDKMLLATWEKDGKILFRKFN
jgi:hypothetical protein